MISVQNLGVEFSATPIFKDVSFIIGTNDRIALVGKNGAGKSTLLKLIAGLLQPSVGSINIKKETTIGYLPQVMLLSDTTTVKEEVMKTFNKINSLREKANILSLQLSERTDYETPSYLALVEEFTHINEQLTILGEDHIEGDVERTLMGLGFKRSDLDRLTSEFSGGWRMRIELAKKLLQSPDILLLDEPTNHLDIESIQWLEDFLISKGCSAVIVSHDRTFINKATNRTLEISCGKIVDYNVKYDEFVKLRIERREQQIRAYENQQKEIADIQAFIDRFRYQATKAVQVQQRIRQLEKIEPIEIDEIDNSKLSIKFPPCQRSGDYPISCDNVSKSFGDHLVFENVNIIVRRGEKIALVGKNGEGKTTFVRCVMQQIPYGGTLKIGHNIQIGYFAQNQAQLLDEKLTVFETIDRIAKCDIRTHIRELLGRFMFRGDDIDKPVRVLSGGERSRLAMIRLLLEPVNLLILDEPTNHLDMKSKDVLKEAIKNFDGTALIVSHDRYFLEGLVDKVYEFGGGKVKEYLGGISDYIEAKKNVNDTPNSSELTNKTNNTTGKSSYLQQKEIAKKKKALEREIKEKEKYIAELEAAIEIIEEQMSNTECGENIYVKYAKLKKQLADAESDWIALAEVFEAENKRLL